MFHFLCENSAVGLSAGAKGYFLDHMFSLDFDNDSWMLLFGSFITLFLPLKNGLYTNPPFLLKNRLKLGSPGENFSA